MCGFVFPWHGTRTGILCSWLGVEKIYLMENKAPPSAELVRQIQDFVEQGLIEYSYEGRGTYQARFYDECMHAHQHKHNWYVQICGKKGSTNTARVTPSAFL